MKKTILFSVFLLMSSLIWAQQINVPADQPSIQAAIEAALEGDTVLVEEGTYFENINFLGKAITVASRFILDKDTAHISKTIIDGSKPLLPDSASVVVMWSGEDTTSVLSGFTITGGSGTMDSQFNTMSGAGIFIDGSGGKICNNIIENNQFGDAENFPSSVAGSALALVVENDHWAIVRENTIRNNTSRGVNIWGGAISLVGCGIIVEQNSIVNNQNIAGLGGNQNWGAGIAIYKSIIVGANKDLIIRGNIISGNSGVSDIAGGKESGGGGISGHGKFETMKINIYNNLISENLAHFGGGIMVFSDELQPRYELNIYNNTIINNEAIEYPNSVGTTVTVFLNLYNNIIWSNVDNGKDDFYVAKGMLELYHNILDKPVKGNEGINPIAESNTYLDPQFDSDTYMHASNSPAVGRAVDSVLIGDKWHFAPNHDINGNPRPTAIDQYMDIGAYESPYAIPLFDIADLSEIKYPGRSLKPAFHKDTLDYEITHVADTISSCEGKLSVMATDAMADVDIAYPDLTSDNEEDWTAYIKVTSSDGSVEKTYSVFFELLSTDATLKSLTVSQGTLYPGFDPEITEYVDTLPSGSSEVPETSCEASHPNADVTVNQAGDLNGTTRISVKSEYGSPDYRKTYKIKYAIPVAVESIGTDNSKLSLYPNPFTSTAKLKFGDQLNVDKIILLNVLGQTLRTYDQIKGNSITIERGDLSTGLYFLQVQAEKIYVIKVLIE